MLFCLKSSGNPCIVNGWNWSAIYKAVSNAIFALVSFLSYIGVPSHSLFNAVSNTIL